MPEPPLPSREDVLSYLRERRNWGRWGRDDEVGAVNLITAEKRRAAAGLVRSGRTVSLSREFPTAPAPGNPQPSQHWMKVVPRGTGGFAADFYGTFYHGWASTHIDALCHTWDEHGMWNGRDAAREITFDGARFGGIHHWKDGIVTRGVLLDVPRHRGERFVRQERPVHGWELAEIAKAHGITVQPGDAVCVYSGREAWQAAHPGGAYGPDPRPGLHVSCLPFLRDHDVAVLAWDMMDLTPNGYDLPWAVHAAIFAFGVALLDNSLLEPLARACAEEGRWEFMLVVAPLRVVGGTGSPANPIAIF